MLAFPNTTGERFTLTEDLLRQGFQASRQSPRLRIILPLHRTQDAAVQRMLNFFQPGTYVQPHIHPQPGQIETIQVLRGRIGFVMFDEQGAVRETHDLRAANALGLIDIEPGIWHGLVALEPDTVILEIKKGPYSAMTDKDFAAWAPKEGTEGTAEYRQGLERLFAG